MNMLPQWQSALRPLTVLLFCVISQLLSGCGAEAAGDTGTYDSEAIEIGKLEEELVVLYENTYLVDGYGKEHFNGTPDRCNVAEEWWDYHGGCAVPKYKTLKIKIMPHDYGGCWGQYWVDAINEAIDSWNAHNDTFETGFTFQKVTSGEHVRIWCQAELPGYGLTTATQKECSQNWPPSSCKGLVKEKKWDVKLGGNNIVGRPSTQADIVWFAKHELGHVLGLAHHNGSTGTSLMGGGGWTPSSEELDFLWAYCPNNDVRHCDGSARPW